MDRAMSISSSKVLSVNVQPDPTGLDRLFVTAPEFDAQFEVYGYCPVQGFGTVRGRDLYFRARHNDWSFDVADNAGRLPSDGLAGSDGFYREAHYANAGWMPLPEAVALIERCLRDYEGARTEPN